MKNFGILLCAVALGSLCVPGLCASEMTYKETMVTLDHGIQGIVLEPEADSPVPAVLMLHGFASQKDEVGNMYQRLAAALGKQGIASLRIDFRGWGESAGKMEESTVQGQVDDAATAYTYLTGLSFVDPARIGVVGFSLGGGIAVISAAQHPEWYASMVTWSSVGDFKPDFLDLGQENFDRAAKEGVVTIDLGWREVTLGHEFFTSLELYNLQEEIKKYSGAFLTIVGSEDFSATYTDSYIGGAAGSKKEAFIIEGADHIFGVLGEDQSMAEQVLQKTVAWFQESL